MEQWTVFPIKTRWVLIPIWLNDGNTKSLQDAVVSEKLYCVFNSLWCAWKRALVSLSSPFPSFLWTVMHLGIRLCIVRGFQSLSLHSELLLAGECLYVVTSGRSWNGLLIQRMTLESVINAWSAILKQDCLVTTQYFVVVVFIHQNWLHFGKQWTYFFFSLSTQQPLYLSNNNWAAKVAAVL